FDERSSDCPILRTDVVSREECVFTCQNNRPDRALDGIGIDLNASIIKEADEPFPMVEAVADCVGKLRTLGDLRQAFLQPGLQRIDDRLTAAVAHTRNHLDALQTFRRALFTLKRMVVRITKSMLVHGQPLSRPPMPAGRWEGTTAYNTTASHKSYETPLT